MENKHTSQFLSMGEHYQFGIVQLKEKCVCVCVCVYKLDLVVANEQRLAVDFIH